MGVSLLTSSLATLWILVGEKIALEALISIVSIFFGWSLLKNAENPTDTKFTRLNRTLPILIITLVIIIYHNYGIKPALGMIYTAAYLSGPAAFGWFVTTRYKKKKEGAKLAAKYQKQVMPGEVDQGDWAMTYITVENTADYAQTWPLELVDDTGNVWWPKGQSWRTQNYTITGDGYLKIYAHKKARILTAIDPLHLKLRELTMATAYVGVKGGSPIIVEYSSCENPYFDYRDRAYRATLVCKVEFRNLESEPVEVRDVTVKTYTLTDALNDTVSGSWSVIPSDLTIDSHSTREVKFTLPLVISTWVPISVADATKLVLKNGDYSTVSFTYTFGYSLPGLEYQTHYAGTVVHRVEVRMDAKTVAADYILSGAMAYVSAWTLLKVPSEFKVKVRGVEFNPAGVFLGIVLYYGKGKVLETLAKWWGD